MTKTEARCRELFRAHNRRWALPLVQVLKTLPSVSWAARLFLEDPRVSNQPKLRTWAARIRALATDGISATSSEEFTQTGGEIWVCDGPVSLVQRGIARLYFSLGFLVSGDDSTAQTEVARAVSLLADDISEAWDERVLEAATRLFRELSDAPAHIEETDPPPSEQGEP